MAKELKRSEYDMTELAEKIRLFREYLGLTSKAFTDRGIYQERKDV